MLAVSEREHLLPGVGRIAMTTLAPHPTGEPPQRLDVDLRGTLRPIRRGMGVTGCGPIAESNTFKQPAQPQTFACVTCAHRPFFHQTQRDRCQDREREQIEAIVLEHRAERAGVAGAHVMHVPRRDFGARNVSSPCDARERLFKHPQGTSSVTAPESPGHREHIEVRHPGERYGATMKEVTSFEDRRIKCSAVEADEHVGIRHPLSNRSQQWPLGAIAGQKELARMKRPIDERAAPNEECIGAGAARQAGRFQIKELERRFVRRLLNTSRRSEHGQMFHVPAHRISAESNRSAAVNGVGRVPAIDDDAEAAVDLTQLAAEDAGRTSERMFHGGHFAWASRVLRSRAHQLAQP